MKRNKLFYIGLISTALLTNTACSDYLDINKNPNYQADAEPVSILPAALVSSGAALGGDLELYGSFWSQHYTQGHTSNQYNTLVAYNITNTTGQYYWRLIYASALPDFKKVVEKAEKLQYWNYWAIGKIMTAYNYMILADLYEKIPFTEAIRSEEIVAPKYDDSKSVVYPGIQTMLDDAIQKIDETRDMALPAIDNSDFVYQGDIDNWYSFAKTMKLKLYMRDFETNKAAIKSLLDENKLMTEDAKLDIFVDLDSKSNPLYENDRRKLNTTLNIRGCNTLMAYLKANNDPRISIYFNKPTKSGTDYTGFEYGERPTSLSVDQRTISLAKLAPEDPVYFMSAVETNFLKAEAYARLNDKASAKQAYDEGVIGAFERWGLDGSEFVADGGAYKFTDASTDEMLQCILTQKWIAAARCQAWDAWFDICRTGIPALGSKYTNEAGYVSGQLTPCKTSVLNAGEFPHRLVFPQASTNYNTNAPEPISITQKMWWHK